MSDDVAVVHEALRARGWRSVAAALGIKWSGERIPCPLHNGDGHNFTLDERDGRLTWICASRCGSSDVLDLIQRLNGCGFKEALREAADIAGVILDDGTERNDEEREQMRRQREAYAEAAKNRQPERQKPLPDPRQSATVWDAAQPVKTDQAVADYLASRAIDPSRTAEHDLARVIPGGCPVPSWATYKGRSWPETGHRLIFQTFDAQGRFVGLRAWRVGGYKETPKRLPQAGFSARGLVLANRAASDMLRDQYPGRLVVCEGEPDWLVHALRNAYAVVGITSGSWDQAIADRVAFGSEVIVRTHCDDAGEKYAQHILRTLRDRVQVWRSRAA
jgi:hypothetical protein